MVAPLGRVGIPAHRLLVSIATMRRDESRAGSSGWSWRAPEQPAPRPPTYRPHKSSGMAGTWLAIALFVAVVIGGVTIGVITFRNHDTAETTEPTDDATPPVAEAKDA